MKMKYDVIVEGLLEVFWEMSRREGSRSLSAGRQQLQITLAATSIAPPNLPPSCWQWSCNIGVGNRL